jgi:hypothetical protein
MQISCMVPVPQSSAVEHRGRAVGFLRQLSSGETGSLSGCMHGTGVRFFKQACAQDIGILPRVIRHSRETRGIGGRSKLEKGDRFIFRESDWIVSGVNQHGSQPFSQVFAGTDERYALPSLTEASKHGISSMQFPQLKRTRTHCSSFRSNMTCELGIPRMYVYQG